MEEFGWLTELWERTGVNGAWIFTYVDGNHGLASLGLSSYEALKENLLTMISLSNLSFIDLSIYFMIRS